MAPFTLSHVFTLATLSLSFLACSNKVDAKFTPIQTELFKSHSGQAVAWADFDNDGDLDLAVGFKNGKVKLYRQDQGSFTEVSEQVGLVMAQSDYRSLSWGDFNRDGYADLYVGFGRDAGFRNLLFVGGQNGFTESAKQRGVDALGTARQSTWLDFDNDGDTDLFVAMRDRSSKLYANENNSFVDVSKATKLNDPRRSVGAVWFDQDKDGDLDLYLPNQSGDRDGLYRNDNGQFTDIAAELNIDRARRPLTEGSVGATLCDVNNDGNMDIFVPVYGEDLLYIADGKGGFTEQAKKWGGNGSAKAVSADCGDFNNDGLMDLYVVAYSQGQAHGFDRLYQNQGDKFVNVMPAELNVFDGDHGVRFADFDNDGDLDLAITNRHKNGRHSIWRNDLDKRLDGTQNYIKVSVLDAAGKFTRQGDEVRVYQSGSDKLLGFQIVDTGGGYVSQNMQPLHFGLADVDQVDIKVTSMSKRGRISKTLTKVSAKQVVEVRVD